MYNLLQIELKINGSSENIVIDSNEASFYKLHLLDISVIIQNNYNFPLLTLLVVWRTVEVRNLQLNRPNAKTPKIASRLIFFCLN